MVLPSSARLCMKSLRFSLVRNRDLVQKSVVNHGQSMSIRIFSMKHGHEMGGIFAVSYPVSCQAPKMVAVLKV